jgi:Uma2 family endonuclease
MAATDTELPMDNLADLLERLGGVGPERVRLRPPPGTATEKDVIEIERRENRLCELVEGVLVEKTWGYRESLLAGALLVFLRQYADPLNLGLVTPSDGTVRLFPGLVRIPDVAFASWDRLPGGRVPSEQVPDLVPDLVVEVLSRGNTPGEIRRKLREYFDAGVRLVWLIDPDPRTVSVHTSPDHAATYQQSQTLEGGDVLPSFTLPLGRLFAELDRRRDR